MKKPILISLSIILSLMSCTTPAPDMKKENGQTKSSKDSTLSKSAYAEVNGIKMYYEIHGQGQPLVLIHGGGSTLFTSFGKIIPLLEKQHQVIAVELQAHGRTSDRSTPESFEQDADDVAVLLNQLAIPKADIMGFSNGGSTALQVAIRHPKQVNKVVAISALYKRDGMFKGFFDFMQKGTFADLPPIYKDAFLSVTPDSVKLRNMYNKDRNRMLTFKDWNDEAIRSIKVPVLVMSGDKDVVQPEHTVELFRLLPQGRLAILPGGHGEFFGEAMTANPNMEMVESSVTIIHNFLKE